MKMMCSDLTQSIGQEAEPFAGEVDGERVADRSIADEHHDVQQQVGRRPASHQRPHDRTPWLSGSAFATASSGAGSCSTGKNTPESIIIGVITSVM